MVVALALLASSSAGCSAALRLSVGPTVDSMGHVGAEVRLTTGLGVAGIMTPLALHAGGAGAGDGHEHVVIGGGAAIEGTMCTQSRVCGMVGLGFIGRKLAGAETRHIDGFGLSGRLGAYYALWFRHSGPGFLLHISTERAIAIGGEIDLTGYVVQPMTGGVFFFGAGVLAAAILH
jgi:hypothetical protein